jgi:DNA-binding HxlR family transcriptional regulator
MASKRTYGDACGIARALDIIGERWALLVVRELLVGPKRFTDIRDGLPGLSPDVLSQRLRDLEKAGLVRRRKLPPPAGSKVYEITDRGAELETVLQSIGTWGARLPMPPEGVGMSFDAHILSFRTLFDPELAGDLDASFQLVLDDQPFRAGVSGGELKLVRGEADAPEATIVSDPGTLLAAAHGRIDPHEAIEAGDIRIDGDRDAAVRFLGLFPLPEPAPEPVPA